MIQQVSLTTLQTVDFPRPNSVESVLYSMFVASLHIVTATRCFTLIGCLKRVTFFIRCGRK